MRKIKFLVASVLFCAMGYVGYTAHEKMTATEAEEFMKANIEALTSGEPGGGGFEYPTGFPYTSECKVKNGTFSKCRVEIITCQGGGNGCNSKKCPVHKS